MRFMLLSSTTRSELAGVDEGRFVITSSFIWFNSDLLLPGYFNVSLFKRKSCWSGRKSSPRIKEMSQELADLFGLTLLVSWKKQAHTTAGDQLVPEPHATTSLKERVETSS
jgi:hypothetical protein